MSDNPIWEGECAGFAARVLGTGMMMQVRDGDEWFAPPSNTWHMIATKAAIELAAERDNQCNTILRIRNVYKAYRDADNALAIAEAMAHDPVGINLSAEEIEYRLGLARNAAPHALAGLCSVIAAETSHLRTDGFPSHVEKVTKWWHEEIAAREALSNAVFDALNEYRVQPAKLQQPIEAFKQLRKWIDMKLAERDDEERRRVAAQNEATALRAELETLKIAAVGLPIVEDIAELIHGDRNRVCETSKTIARVYQHSIAPIIQYQHNTISALRAKLWPLETAARDVVATHDVSWGSGAHSDAIDALRALIGDNNG